MRSTCGRSLVVRTHEGERGDHEKLPKAGNDPRPVTRKLLDDIFWALLNSRNLCLTIEAHLAPANGI